MFLWLPFRPHASASRLIKREALAWSKILLDFKSMHACAKRLIVSLQETMLALNKKNYLNFIKKVATRDAKDTKNGTKKSPKKNTYKVEFLFKCSRQNSLFHLQPLGFDDSTIIFPFCHICTPTSTNRLSSYVCVIRVIYNSNFKILSSAIWYLQ